MTRPVVLRNQVLRVFSWLAAVGVTAGTAAIVLDGPPDSDYVSWLLALAIFLLITVSLWRATRLRIELTDDGVTAHKLFGRQHLAWQDVGDVSVDEFGLRIMRTDGGVVTVGSMGKPRLWIWLTRESTADTWVRQVKARASAAKHAT